MLDWDQRSIDAGRDPQDDPRGDAQSGEHDPQALLVRDAQSLSSNPSSMTRETASMA